MINSSSIKSNISGFMCLISNARSISVPVCLSVCSCSGETLWFSSAPLGTPNYFRPRITIFETSCAWRFYLSQKMSNKGLKIRGRFSFNRLNPGKMQSSCVFDRGLRFSSPPGPIEFISTSNFNKGQILSCTI